MHTTCQAVAEAVAAHPGRFLGAVGLDPKLGYQAARHVRVAVEEYGMRAIRILPMWTGIPIDDPLNYPLYTAACDLGVPVCINVGVPGPMKPARLQRTILVDEVALVLPRPADRDEPRRRPVGRRDDLDAREAPERVSHDRRLRAEVPARAARAVHGLAAATR